MLLLRPFGAPDENVVFGNSSPEDVSLRAAHAPAVFNISVKWPFTIGKKSVFLLLFMMTSRLTFQTLGFWSHTRIIGETHHSSGCIVDM